jgi:glycerophosphoryl diester phosphodiesterase
VDWLAERPFAHRGLHDASAGRPENSLAAFAAAAAAGYGIELDVQLTADGRLAVFHDDELAGVPVARRPYAALAEAGAPLLAEALALVGGAAPLLVELKAAGGAAAVAERAAEELRGYAGPLAVMSFDAAALAHLRPRLPEVPLGLVAEAPVALPAAADFLALEQAALPSPRVAAHPLLAWTVRSPRELERARSLADQAIFEGFAAPPTILEAGTPLAARAGATGRCWRLDVR